MNKDNQNLTRKNLEYFFDLSQKETTKVGNLSKNDFISSSEIIALLRKNYLKRYTDFVKINEGGVKKIYTAYDRITQRQIVVTRLKEHNDIEKSENFIYEALVLAYLSHPNILPIYDIGINKKGEPWFTTKHLQGNTLQQLLYDDSNLSLRTKLDIFLKVCDAIDYAHSKGIIHLDLKPSNIYISYANEVIVCDWGIAKFDSNKCELSSKEFWKRHQIDFIQSSIIGTPGYMSPEQTQGKNLSHLCDIYSLGAILYTLLANKAPIEGDDITTVLNKTMNNDITSMDTKFNNKALSAVCFKALDNNPDKRYLNVVEIKQEIIKYLDGFATKAEDASNIKTISLYLKRNATKLVIYSLAIILIILIIYLKLNF